MTRFSCRILIGPASAKTCGGTALLLVFILAAGAAFASSPASFPDVISEDAGRFAALLSSPVAERRVEGIQGVTNLKHWPAESAVLHFLDDASPMVRREAVLALGRLGSARTIPRFIELLDDPSWEIRQNIWLGLGRMTAQDLDATNQVAWAKWWAESTLAQKEHTLLSLASGSPDPKLRDGTSAAYVPTAPGRRGRQRASLSPPAHPQRRDALRALVHLASRSSEDALLGFLQQPQSPPLDADEQNFLCEALERTSSSRAIPVLAAQRSDAAAWALGSLGGPKAERALLGFPRSLSTLLALDRLRSTNAGPFLPELVGQMGQITYRSQPDDVMNEDLQPIQRVGANLIRRSGHAPLLIECVLQELEDSMKPPLAHGPRPAAPPGWDEMFKRMRSELKPGFVREDGTTTTQPVVAMCYLMSDGCVDGNALPNGVVPPSPSPLNGKRAGAKGENVERVKPVEANQSNNPSPSIPLPVEGRGKPEQQLVQRLIPLLRHPAIVPRVYVALALGRMQAREASPPIVEMIREGYPFSDSVALASGKHFDQSQNVRWRGFLCLALGRMGGDEARKALEGFAADPKQPRDIRYCAVTGLGFVASPDSLPVLERVANKDIIWLVRDEARQIAWNIQLTKQESRR